MDVRRFTLDRCPLFPVAVTFIIGILISQSGYEWLALGISTVIAIILCFTRYSYAGILSASVAAGVLAGIAGRPESPPENFFDRDLVLTGVVERMDEGDATRNIIVKIDSVDGRYVTPFKVFVVSWTFNPVIVPADRIVFSAQPEHLDMTTDLPLEFNYGEYLYRQGVVATAFIQESGDVYSITPERGMRYSLMRLRSEIVDMISASDLMPATKTFLITTLTGDRSFLTPADRDLFSRAGVAHILALSGLHVAIISLVVSWLLFPLTVLRRNKLKMCVIVVVLWAYAIMTGLTPSVVRAVIMASVFVLSRILERQPSPLNSLSFAAICILLFDPSAIYSAGFQLSFAAVIFILLFAEKLNPVNKRNRPLYTIVAWFTTSFAAAMGTGIVSAGYFHQFPVYFLIANIPFTLLLPFTLGGGILFLISGALGLHFRWLDLTLDFLCVILERIADAVSSLPGAAIDGLYVSPCMFAVFLTGMAAVAFMLHTEGRRSIAVAASVTIIAVVISAFVPVTVKDSGVYFPRHKRYCIMMVSSPPILEVFTTAYISDFSELEELVRRKYFQFMTSRGIDSINISRVNNSVVTVDGRKYVFAGDAPALNYKEGTELILTRGFTPDMITPSLDLPSRVLISPCINSGTARKISSRLEEINVKSVDLKTESYTGRFEKK